MRPNQIRRRKRIHIRHQSQRRMAFYAEENAQKPKPFRCYTDRQNKVI